ncbi:MAG: AsmA family protein [Thalassobaculaceae bacterium]|nr:AsmA family protein [Thalassobaculaceae bacterium]
MRWVRILAGVVGVLAIALIGLVIFVATLDLNAYKAEIEAAVAEATGRNLSIEGDLDLAWTPRPTLTTDTVHFANAAWGSRSDMATIGKLEIAVEVVPLLSGTVDVQRIALSDVDILLERDDKGIGNWQIGETDSAGGSGGDTVAPLLRNVELIDVTIAWKPTPGSDTKTARITRLDLAAEDGSAPLDVTLEADIDGDPVTLNGTLPAVAEALRPGATLPIDVTGSIGGLGLTLATNLRYTRSSAGALTAIEADRLSASAGALAVTGTVSVALDGPRPKIEADLKTDGITLAEGDGGSDGDDALETPLPLGLLTLVDATFKLAIGTLTVGELEISDIAVTASLQDGVLTLDPAGAVLSKGRIEAVAVVNAAQATPSQALTASWRDADFGELARALHGSDTLEATGDAALDLTATGSSVRDMLASLGGTAWITTENGRIASEDWKLIAADLATQFLPFLEEGGRGTLNCAVGRWAVKRGVAETAILMIDSDRVIIAGEGSIDLARETLNMKLTPAPKDASLVSLATPIVFTGDIRDPNIAPDPLAVAKGVGSIVGGVALAGPFAVLLPFMSSGSDEPACGEAVAIAEGRKAMPAAGGAGGGSGTSSNEQPDKPGGIKGLFDNLRKAVE